MKKISLLACAFFIANASFAQDNLVVNGSFEDYTGKITKIGAISQSNSWASATGAKADFFAPTKAIGIGTPDNMYGSEKPKDGDCYAGIMAYSYGDKVPRTYLITRLSETLKKGKKYCISYNVSLAEGSKYAVNQMGALLSKKEFESDSKASLVENAQIKSTKIHNALYGWDKVCGVIVAEGGEKFIVIGNFNATKDILNEKSKPEKGTKVTPIVGAYYYIDEVSVFAMDEDTECDCQAVEPEVEYSKLVYNKQVNIDETKSTPKDIVQAQELYFGFGQADLSPSGKLALDKIASLLLANTNFKLEINGHTDAEEDVVAAEKAQYADMDNKRIAVVMDYLKSKGIATERMIPSTQGSSEKNANILTSDDAEVAQAKNRRVTFTVR